jgi:FAD-linked oxidoreductase
MPEVWTNWAGQQRCAPAIVARPRTEDELREAVAAAAGAGQTVRPVGRGHSFTDMCVTDGCMVDLRHMDRVLDADPATGLVRVQAGISIHVLAERLHSRGLALENQGDIDVQALAGALATATHGTGARFGNLSSRVVGARIVTAAGDVVDAEGDMLKAARVSLGALGVLSEVTVECVPAFRIRRVDAPEPLADVLATLDERVAGSDHFELFAFPHADRCLTLTSERTDAPAAPRPPVRAWLEEELVQNRLLGLFMRAGRLMPRATPQLNRLLTRALSRTEQLDHSHRVYANERKVRFTEMEYAIPRAHAREAVERVSELIARRRIPVSFPIEVRFAAADDAFLSTAADRDTAYVAVHQFVGMEYESYFRAVEQIMDGYEGRPHWGKRHYQSAATLAPRYAGWDDFQAVRARHDPAGAFANDYVARTLGPVAAAKKPRRRPRKADAPAV